MELLWLTLLAPVMAAINALRVTTVIINQGTRATSTNVYALMEPLWQTLFATVMAAINALHATLVIINLEARAISTNVYVQMELQ